MKAIAVEEDTALLLDPDGTSRVVGAGPVYFLRATRIPVACWVKTPLRFENISTHRAPSGTTFNVNLFRGQDGSNYVLSVHDGKVASTAARKEVY